MTWKNGIKEGPERIYNENPRYLKTEIPWVAGKIEGIRKTFYENGKIASETPYVKGKAHGVAKSFSADGKVMRECTLKKGLRDGKLTDYWPETGKSRRSIHYKMGKVTGVVRQYHDNGQLKSEVSFRNDAMHGEEKRFERDGKPAKSRYWLNGNFVTKTEFELKYK